MALGQLAFAGLFFGAFAVVLDIVAEFVSSDIPAFGKAYDMAIDDGFYHLVQDSGDGLSSVAFGLFLNLGPKVLDDLSEAWIGPIQAFDIAIHGCDILVTEGLLVIFLLLDHTLDQHQDIGIVDLIDLDRLQFIVDIQLILAVHFWIPALDLR